MTEKRLPKVYPDVEATGDKAHRALRTMLSSIPHFGVQLLKSLTASSHLLSSAVNSIGSRISDVRTGSNDTFYEIYGTLVGSRFIRFIKDYKDDGETS